MTVTIASVQLVSRDRPLSGRAAAIASKLLWYGNWVDAGQHVERDGNRMLWVDHLFAPTEDEEDWGEGCAMIGSLSGIISNAYLAGAASTIHTSSNSPVLDPGSMGQFIPDDFEKLVASAIHDAAAMLGEEVRTASVTDPDLFMHALGCSAIVYVAEPRLLDARGEGDPERMRAVVRASHAPGVGRVVVVFPQTDVWGEEARVLQKDGVGYTILRSRPLVDELADATNLHAARSVWLPRGKNVDLVSRAALAAAIRDGITRDDWCGATIDVPSEAMEIAEARRGCQSSKSGSRPSPPFAPDAARCEI